MSYKIVLEIDEALPDHLEAEDDRQDVLDSMERAFGIASDHEPENVTAYIHEDTGE